MGGAGSPLGFSAPHYIQEGTLRMAGLSPVSNDGEPIIVANAPYTVLVRIEGTSSLLFHRWSVEGIEAKASAAKGSRAKKTDDVASYVWRNEEGEICLPTEYVRQAVIHAAKYRQDPRSPRKSAMDLFKAAIVAVDELATLGVKDWDYLDQRRVTVQRAGLTRSRPALNAGWQAEFRLMVLLPEYVPPVLLREVLTDAGRLVGVGDFRPTYGRFGITKFESL
jgi:hypothetical protein